MSKFVRRVVLLLMALLAISLVACGGGDDGGGDESIKVGAIFDLTGATSDVGTPYSEGVKDFVAWYNDNGGVDGRSLELVSADYAYKVDQAEQLYTQYVNQGIVAFQGWGTGDTEALRTRIATDEIPFMSASYSDVLGNPDEAPYNFLIGTGYAAQAITAVQWGLDNGASKFAIFHHDSPFGTSPVAGATAFAEANGATMAEFPMPGGATDFTAELTQVQDAGIEYILIQNVSSPAATLVKNIKDFGLDVQVVCLNWCTDELFASLAGDAGEGVLGASPFAFPGSGAAGLKEMDDYLQSKGSSLEEKGLRYVAGWLTMKVMTEGIEKVVADGNEVTGPNIKAALESMSNIDTGNITTPLSFSTTDHASNKAVQFFQIEGGKWTAVSDLITVP
ncbi:MAG: ABC transporter substrate-binding protein [Ardenticatenaceae bacterium]|nr:ABC transporter substrate-binding protein [Anaerolineales bacterium]MCB8923580.1 ABC transporter substrate-binding protein [Ardenticatenaceae bacterium]MCB9003520.1 ABC transporter substrate-binding protein [Ardenticatenaceae bacterium]